MVTIIASVLNAFLYAVFFAELIVRYPCNHAGGTGMYWRGLALVAAIDVGLMAWRRRVAWWQISFIVLFGVLLLTCDERNILVDYDTWAARGMPDWGESISVHY